MDAGRHGSSEVSPRKSEQVLMLLADHDFDPLRRKEGQIGATSTSPFRLSDVACSRGPSVRLREALLERLVLEGVETLDPEGSSTANP